MVIKIDEPLADESVMSVRRYTSDDLWKLSQLPEYADRQLELFDGEIIVMAPSSAIPAIITSQIDRVIGNYVEANDLGYVTSSEGAYDLPTGDTFAPDVGFVAKERIDKLPERFFQLAPDLAVEVLSPTDSVKKTLRKAARYLAAGTKLVWVIDPGDQTVYVCRAAPAGEMDKSTIPAAMLMQEFGRDGTLDGLDALPGFRLPVADLFKRLPINAPEANKPD